MLDSSMALVIVSMCNLNLLFVFWVKFGETENNERLTKSSASEIAAMTLVAISRKLYVSAKKKEGRKNKISGGSLFHG